MEISKVKIPHVPKRGRISNHVGLVNYPYTRCRLGYHGVWIRSPTFLPRVKELLLLYYVKLRRISVYSSGSLTTSWFHHITIQIVPISRFASTQSSYMGKHSTFFAIVACRLLMYSPMVWNPVTSIAATTEGYYHSPHTPRVVVIHVIHLIDRWRNPSNTFRIPPVTTQISLLYRSNNCTTALYITPRDLTVDTVFISTLAIMTHRLCAFRRLWYTADQSLLL